MHAQLVAVVVVLLFSGGDATSLRLQGSTSQWDGRVEVLYENEWGTICDIGWDLADANVTCVQLGFLLGVGVTTMSSYGGAGDDVRVWVEEVECEGSESDISECETVGGWGDVSSDCENHTRDAGVICANDPDALSVRLVGGATVMEGRVEVLFGDGWGGVCDDGWGLEEANVVCRQLGYDFSEEIPAEGDFGEGEDIIWMDEVVCEGDERRLADCQHAGWAGHDCLPSENAKVQCANLDINCTVRVMPTAPFDRAWLGAVELFVNDEWGKVCSDTWDITDASVLCRQLGYHGALEATALTTDLPSGLYWLAGVECMGSEENLCRCPSSGVVNVHSNCTTMRDAGVVCKAVAGDPYDLRLVGGAYEWEGRVEISINNEWGTVCSFGVTMNDAIVMCRQLGYSTALIVYFLPVFGEGLGVQWFDSFTCSGTEDNIFNCPRNGGLGQILPGCDHQYDLSVICQADANSDNETAPIRLVGGASLYEGRVEVLYNGRWGLVCEDGWNEAAANITCRQLGYGMAVSYDAVPVSTTGLILVWLDEVMCNGTETALSACPHSMWGEHDCSPNTAAGVTCSEPVTDPNEVRLVGGPVEHSGRVEVFYGGVWGTVCDTGWDIDDGEVVCRQLGYPGAMSLLDRGGFTEGVGVVWLEGIDCRGNETRLTECGFLNWGQSRCDHTHDAGVICESPKSISSSDVISMPTTSQLMLLPLSPSYDEQATPTTTITMVTMDISPTIVKSSEQTRTQQATPTDNISSSDTVITPVVAIGAGFLIGVVLVTLAVGVVFLVIWTLMRRHRKAVWTLDRASYENRGAENYSLSVSLSSLPQTTVMYNEEAENPPGETLDTSMNMPPRRNFTLELDTHFENHNADYESLSTPTTPPQHLTTPTSSSSHTPVIELQSLAMEGAASNNGSPPLATFV